jgi:hypothetical protein
LKISFVAAQEAGLQPCRKTAADRPYRYALIVERERDRESWRIVKEETQISYELMKIALDIRIRSTS